VIGEELEHVTEIARRMREHHVGSVVIVQHAAQGTIPIGVLTDRDIVLGLVAVDPSYLERAIVKDLLPGKLVTVREDASLFDVVVRMRSHGVRRMPVVSEAGVLVGIIAFDDLLGHLAEELQRLGSLVERETDKERKARPAFNQSA
jgi:CBS domain-containing protein